MENGVTVSQCNAERGECLSSMMFSETTYKDFTFSVSCTLNAAYDASENLYVALRMDKQISSLYPNDDFSSISQSMVMKEVSAMTTQDLEVMASEFFGVKSVESSCRDRSRWRRCSSRTSTLCVRRRRPRSSRLRRR